LQLFILNFITVAKDCQSRFHVVHITSSSRESWTPPASSSYTSDGARENL